MDYKIGISSTEARIQNLLSSLYDVVIVLFALFFLFGRSTDANTSIWDSHSRVCGSNSALAYKWSVDLLPEEKWQDFCSLKGERYRILSDKKREEVSEEFKKYLEAKNTI